MRRNILFSFAVLFIPVLLLATDEPAAWTPASIIVDDDTHVQTFIRLKNDEILVAALSEVSYVGELKTKARPPFLIFKGKPCFNCDTSRLIYVVSPEDGRIPGP